jgi:anti-sigma B factor antagonist
MASRFSDDDQDLVISSRQESGVTVVVTQGDVTAFSSSALRQTLRKLAEGKPGRVIVDLAGTRYIDSSGVATLVEALQTMRRNGGELVLAGVNPRVRGVFEIARLDNLFPMAASVEDALKA